MKSITYFNREYKVHFIIPDPTSIIQKSNCIHDQNEILKHWKCFPLNPSTSPTLSNAILPCITIKTNPFG
ncbi:hypothetical protein EB796_018809 [Bugula neritina]|uniref:Uncharacterized protein n=1 Tax=Bugula neritina TaxID=10212 RepID=A0A7J7JA51_BUGNE|nr:hypothetical protein EB796_018809 [Bugula neritina]